ncbi:MAG: hypothetical protein ACLQLC_15945 [Candidatus Sulfotelmatobacter sp.]
MHHHAGPHLAVAVTDVDLCGDNVVEDKKGPQRPMPVHFNAGESKWIPGGFSHWLTNTGPKIAKLVTLEFP